MTPEERESIRKELGLDTLPAPRGPVPQEHPPVSPGGLLNFHKALSCVDALSTAAFERFIPPSVVIDQSLSARTFHPFFSKAVSIRTDLPPPVDERITRLTGIPYERSDRAFFAWLAQELRILFEGHAPRASSPPLIFRTDGFEGTVPLMGFIVFFDMSPADGETLEDRLENNTASMALLVGPEDA